MKNAFLIFSILLNVILVMLIGVLTIRHASSTDKTSFLDLDVPAPDGKWSSIEKTIYTALDLQGNPDKREAMMTKKDWMVVDKKQNVSQESIITSISDRLIGLGWKQMSSNKNLCNTYLPETSMLQFETQYRIFQLVDYSDYSFYDQPLTCVAVWQIPDEDPRDNLTSFDVKIASIKLHDAEFSWGD